MLGKALQLLAYSDDSGYMHSMLLTRITNNYQRPANSDGNPIAKNILVISGDDAQVYFDEVGTQEGGGNPNLVGNNDIRNQLLDLQSQLSALRRIVEQSN